MKNYLDLCKDVLENGTNKGDRTGVGTRALFGRMLQFDLSKGFPALTTRPSPFRIAFEETMFFLRGETDTTKLEDKNIKIWKGNTTREFLDGRGLTYLPEGDMGKGYGYQWRRFGGEERQVDENQNTVAYGLEGIDQVADVLDGLKNDPNGRRHIISAWNPAQLDEMALPPCHILNQYVVNDGKLDSSFTMRSSDIIYGLGFNIMSYAFLNIAFAKMLNLEPGNLVYFGNDVHIYNNQIEMTEQQILRTPRALPQLKINKELNDLDDILSLEFSDLELIGYNPYPDFKDKPPMAT